VRDVACVPHSGAVDDSLGSFPLKLDRLNSDVNPCTSRLIVLLQESNHLRVMNKTVRRGRKFWRKPVLATHVAQTAFARFYLNLKVVLP
jgi:hypothetical protein